LSAPGGAPRRILFTTSNGTGLGHLTRSMAIARRLPDGVEPHFLTLSAAAPVVEQMGFPVEYVPSYATPASGNDYRWSRRLRGRLRAVIADLEPTVIVFDGTHPYEALLGALPAAGTAVWCRRPLWKPGSSRVPLGRAGSFDAVLEPGELAEAEDAGPTVALRDRAHRVGPVVLLDRSELLPRAVAAAELGLDPERPAVLVALGQGAEVSETTRRALTRLAAAGGVQVAALSSALAAAAAVPPGVTALRATYPMSRYFAAFDAAVAAAGYNAYHELIALGVPALFVPMARETDDQPARARYAERAGIGFGLASTADPELEAKLDRLLDPGERSALAANLSQLAEPRGAAEAAAWLADLATREWAKTAHSQPQGATRGGWRDFRRRWGQFAASLPRTAWRLGRQTLTEPRARVLVLALGIESDAVIGAVREALAEPGEEPRRVLVVTDSLAALGELRALGVGIEHVPAAGSRAAELAGVPYEEFLARRLELIRAERPEPRRTIVAPGGAPVP
jgi:UDP-N-acetylglucosamine--N-acetylmuramyl-(pentapeptide) pyrophosphoryl-undecaprenol N-acetylglucosamine transferase